MTYDISKPNAPKMPNLGKGTECIKIGSSVFLVGRIGAIQP